MRPRYVLALLLLLAPTASRAAEVPPEQLLPATTQVYVRWDGVTAHKEAYAKTAIGKMMAGDTGTFVTRTFDQIQDGIGALLTVEQLLSGVEPNKLRQLRADATKAAKLLPLLGESGFIFAAELKAVEPPQGQITLILPNAGPRSAPLFSALRLATALAKADAKTRKIEGREVHVVGSPFINMVWWVEGKHAILRAGTGKIDDLVKAVTGKDGERLTSNPLYKRVSEFKTFRTSARAFINIGPFVQLGSKHSKEAAKLISDLGVDGIKSVVFYSGFEGKAERGLIEVDIPGPRKGALALFKGKPFRLEDLPAIPPDAVSWTMTNLDVGVIYDVVLRTAENVAGMVGPDEVKNVREFYKQVNDVLGVDLRKDLLGSLGDRFATYSTPSEGPLTLGTTFLFKVKNEEKLEESLEGAIRGLSKAANADVRIRKRTYKGAVLREVQIRERGFPFRPTYAIYKGWLAVSFFPQPIQGWVSRTKGDMKSWKPTPEVAETFKSLPRDAISISYSDPRPALKQLLSIAPMIAALIDSQNQDIDLDVGSIPNAQELTRHLFPNVSVATDDGKTVRLESRASLSLPLDLGGIDTYGLLIFFSIARFL
jgi:hypothetical protein